MAQCDLEGSSLIIFRNISGSQTSSDFCLQNTIFLVVTTVRRHLVCRGQGCLQHSTLLLTASTAKNYLSPNAKRTRRNPEICNPQQEISFSFFFLFFSYSLGGVVNISGVEDLFSVVLERLQNNKKAILENYSKTI